MTPHRFIFYALKIQIPLGGQAMSRELKKLEKMLKEGQDAYYEHKLKKCMTLMMQVIEKARPLGPPAEELLAGALNVLAGCYRQEERLPEAVELTHEVLTLMRRTVGPEHGDYAGMLNNMGQMLVELGREAEAIPYFQQALDIKKPYLSHVIEQSKGDDPSRENLSTFLNLDEIMEWTNSLSLTYFDLHQALMKTGQQAEATRIRQDALPAWQSDCTSELALHITEGLIDGDCLSEAILVCEAQATRLLKALSEPRNNFAVINPNAMQFELAKQAYADTGRVPAEYLQLLIRLQTLRHLLDQPTIPASEFPELNDITAQVCGTDSMECAHEHMQLGVEFHLLAQATQSRDAFRLAETHYRREQALLQHHHLEDDPIYEEVLDNLRELYEDQGLSVTSDLQ
jgi:tetratricopeptide (TPR) repeat protein